jgi:hypothetical protein
MTRIEAQYFLNLHKETYHVYWKWSEKVVDHAMIFNFVRTDFGWKRRITAYKNKKTRKEQPNPRSIANFKIQAAGAEMMRVAACFATEAGIRICCPVHDAFLIEAPDYRIGEEVERMRACMDRASRAVLGGFTVKVDHKIVTWPDRYMDEDGDEHWNQMLVENIIAAQAHLPTWGSEHGSWHSRHPKQLTAYREEHLAAQRLQSAPA